MRLEVERHSLCLVEVGPGELVVEDGVGVAIVAFQPTAGVTHPSVVHRTAENAEVNRQSTRKAVNQVAHDDICFQEAYGYIGTAL